MTRFRNDNNAGALSPFDILRASRAARHGDTNWYDEHRGAVIAAMRGEALRGADGSASALATFRPCSRPDAPGGTGGVQETTILP